MLLLIAFSLLVQDPEARIHQELSKFRGHPEAVDLKLLEAGKSSSQFGTRYAALIVQLEMALATGERASAAWSAAATLSIDGGPKGAAEHLRALAASFKAAILCRDCKDGKVACGRCAGKKRVDLPCQACDGKGRVGAPGAVDKTAVTMKCRNCDGKAFFRDVRCPGCSGSGQSDCASCGGSPWHDRACTVRECRSGRVPCARCKGRGRVEVSCPGCGGKGRLGAPGAVDPSQVTMRCNECDAKGVLKEKAPCPDCSGGAAGLGWARCDACEKGKAPRVTPTSEVFGEAPCGACEAKGWREGKACGRCAGLGARLKPASDPGKTLD